MSTEQLRAIVIEKILYEQNEATLQDILSVLSERDSSPVLLSPEQRASISAGLADYESDRFITSSELNQQEAEWL
jgi:hypothetical protein